MASLLAALPLAAIAAFEAVQPMSQTVESLEMSRAAAGRLVELTDVPPPVVDRRAPGRSRRRSVTRSRSSTSASDTGRRTDSSSTA